MKIVIPTNDLVNMERKTGHAKYFAVYEVNNDNIELLNKVENEHDHNEEGHTHKEQAKMLSQYDAFVVNHLGSHFKTDVLEARVNVFFTKKSVINEAIADFLENGEH